MRLAVQQSHGDAQRGVQSCQSVPQGDVGPHRGTVREAVQVPARALHTGFLQGQGCHFAGHQLVSMHQMGFALEQALHSIRLDVSSLFPLCCRHHGWQALLGTGMCAEGRLQPFSLVAPPWWSASKMPMHAKHCTFCQGFAEWYPGMSAPTTGSQSGGHGKQCQGATWTKLCLSPEPAIGFADAGVARQAGLRPGLPIARDARIHQLWLEVLQYRGLAQSAGLCGR